MSTTLERGTFSPEVFIGHERGTFTHHLIANMFDSLPESGDATPPLSAEKTADLLSRGNPTEFGSLVLSAMKERTVIDLGCGPTSANTTTRALGRLAGAASYIGVDLEDVSEAQGENDGFPEDFAQSDLVDFLTTYTPGDGSFFLISGIEPQDYPIQDEHGNWRWPPPFYVETSVRKEAFNQVKNYIHTALSEIARITAPGDSLLIGVAPHWQPEGYGFQKIADTKMLGNENRYWVTKWEKLVKKYMLYTKPHTT